jgi:hypothetical protein
MCHRSQERSLQHNAVRVGWKRKKQPCQATPVGDGEIPARLQPKATRAGDTIHTCTTDAFGIPMVRPKGRTSRKNASVRSSRETMRTTDQPAGRHVLDGTLTTEHSRYCARFTRSAKPPYCSKTLRSLQP